MSRNREIHVETEHFGSAALLRFLLIMNAADISEVMAFLNGRAKTVTAFETMAGHNTSQAILTQIHQNPDAKKVLREIAKRRLYLIKHPRNWFHPRNPVPKTPPKPKPRPTEAEVYIRLKKWQALHPEACKKRHKRRLKENPDQLFFPGF